MQSCYNSLLLSTQNKSAEDHIQRLKLQQTKIILVKYHCAYYTIVSMAQKWGKALDILVLLMNSYRIIYNLVVCVCINFWDSIYY